MLFRFFKREKKTLPPQPLAGRLLNLAAIAVFAGVIIYQMKHGSRPEPAPPITAAQPVDALSSYYIQAAQHSALNFFHRLGASEAPVWSELKPGTGVVAVCGQEVDVGVALLETDGKTTIKGLTGLLPGTRRWRLGTPEQAIDNALQPLVLNLRAGGVREARLPLSLIHAMLAPEESNDHGSPHDRLVLLRATLTKAEPAPASQQPLIVLEPALGDPDRQAACGQPVTLAVRMWSLDGKELRTLDDVPIASDMPLLPSDNAHKFTGILGQRALPYGMERAVEGMGMGATRVALIPPELQMALGKDGKLPPRPMFPIPAQTVIAQMTLYAMTDAKTGPDTVPSPPPAATESQPDCCTPPPPLLHKSEPLVKPAHPVLPIPAPPVTTESSTP